MADDAELLAEIRSLQANKCPDYTIPSEARDSQAYKNTLGVVRRAWEDYYKDCCNPSATEDAWSSIPGEAQLQAFFLWCLLKRKGKLGGKLTVQTFKKYLIQLRRLFRDRHGGTPISLRTSENLRNYVNGGLAQRGASREAMPRPVATPAVVIDILYFLWALDEHEFDHPRMRLQLSFSITLLLYFGIRPGEFIESSSHSGGNEGVFYGDLDVMVLLHEGRRRFAIEVQLRNRKGVRGLRVKDTSMALLQEFERPELCPVAQLFALALADGAFEDFHSAADIRNIATPPPDVFQRLRVRESMKKVPVLRRLEGRGKATSQERIATCKELGPVMEALGHRAGHRERFTPYTIRRGHGGLLDRAVSAARRQQRMGHANSQTFQHYLNKFSTIDGQSMVLGRPMEQDVLDRVASMASSVDVNAPKPAGASLTDTGRHNQRAGLQAHRDERKQYFDSPSAFATAVARPELHDKEYVLAAQGVSRGRPVPSAVFDRYLQWDTDRSRIIQMFYKRKPEQGLQLEDMLEPLTSIAGTDSSTWRYPETVLGSDGGCECGIVQSRERDTAMFNYHLLCCYMRRRSEELTLRLSRRIEKLHAVCPLPRCSRDLARLALPSIAKHIAMHLRKHESKRLRQQKSKRLGKHATWCLWPDCLSTPGSAAELRLHILHHHSLPLPDTLPALHYCYDCRTYFPSALEWDEHNRKHVEDPSMFCGQILRRNVILVACRCPFCLGAVSLPPAQRASPHRLGAHFYNHLIDHLGNITTCPFTCPHPLCEYQITSAELFWDHFHAKHGIEGPKKDTKAYERLLAVTSLLSDTCASVDSITTLPECDVSGDPSRIDLDLTQAMLTGGACAPAGQITTSSLEHDIRNDERMVDLERSTVDTWTETIDLTQEATPVEPSARTALPRTAMQRHRNHLLAATQELSQDPVDKKSSRVKGHSTQRVRHQKKRPCVAEDRHAIWSGVY